MKLQYCAGRAVVWYYKRADRAMRNTFGEPLAADVAPGPEETTVLSETEKRLRAPTLTLFEILALVILTALIIADALVSAVERVSS